ncbi:hypothetical protein GCM10007984_11390 [Shewanella putrefaciens]|nr:hypothetical protein GCM10007984_11390 [Shewanella putrefaciens]
MVGVKLWMVLCLFLATLLAISGYYQIPWPLITIFILLYIIIAVLIVRSSNGVKLASIKEYTVKSYSGNDFNNLEDFRAWFKDDSIITCTEQLGPELQVYAKRITERLRHSDKHDLAQAQHIALCGPYGCGKSSIVDSIANELAKSSERDGIWIHSDISTWGAASGSVAHIVLSNIIDDISQHIDMCAFRALPKHYTEALKSGGSWLQFTSTLLAGPVDPEKNFQRLNDVLKATNHKLLITLQDVDRGTDEESKKRLNAIAALLDRLKDRKLKQVNFIVATGYEKPFAAEIISKATDYREDIAKINFRITLASFIKISIDNAKETERVITFYEYGATHERLKLDQINAIINSSRQLKKILRRVDQAWQPTKLMGEINFHSLIMVAALRETNPTYFERYCRADAYLESKIKNNKDDLGSVLREIAQISKNNQDNSLVTQGDDLKGEIIFNYLQEMLDVKREHSGKLKLDSTHDHKQSVGCTNSDIDYLKRILLEQVPDYELRDQDVITIVKEGESNLPKFTAEYQALENSIHEAQYSLFTEKIGSEEQKKYVREM